MRAFLFFAFLSFFCHCLNMNNNFSLFNTVFVIFDRVLARKTLNLLEEWGFLSESRGPKFDNGSKMFTLEALG